MSGKDKELKSKSTVDQAAMAVAYLWATVRSKDPSTKVGACIVDSRTGGLFLGYNGFPAGVPDLEAVWQQREPREGLLTKYDLVVHAEVNATRKALMAGVELSKAVLVTTVLPCPHCMKDVVLANAIKCVIYDAPEFKGQTARDRWVVTELARLAGVKLLKTTSQRGVLTGLEEEKAS